MSDLDVSELMAFAEDLTAEAAGIDARMEPVLDRQAEKLADGQRDRVRKRSRETEKSITVDKPNAAERVIGPDQWTAVFLETGTSRARPFPFAFNDIDAATAELARDAVAATMQLRGKGVQ